MACLLGAPAAPRRRRSPKLSAEAAAGTGARAEGAAEKAAAQVAQLSSPLTRYCFGSGDDAAGGGRQISLSEPGALAKLCCCVPGILLFGLMLVVVATAGLSSTWFYLVTAFLSVYTFSYSAILSFFCPIGAWRMRRDTDKDWDAMLAELRKRCQEPSEIMHIVILPNYKEEEHMLEHTLENLARSSMAKGSMHVVLAMEEREGQAARSKAQRLIAKCSKNFADVIATYHPPGLPDDLAGKSSNTQWAYRDALLRYGPAIARLGDPSRVLLTVGDADTLWHPQYFSAMAYQALGMPRSERVWSMWQPPILLMRNLFSCPGPTRVTGYATILYELSGLANQGFVPHFTYSAYSLSLALATHPMVGGWDRDVIAEDHHMFCKCYFASIRDQLACAAGEPAAKRPHVQSQLKVQPVMLPAISYLVESDGGWLASFRARFQQARRHSQGVSELSYVILQYLRILLSGGTSCLPLSTHARICAIIESLITLHIMNAVQMFSMVVVVVMLLPSCWSWLLAGGHAALLGSAAEQGLLGAIMPTSFAGLRWAFCVIFGPIPPIGMLMTATSYIVVRDLLEGRLTRDVSAQRRHSSKDAAGVGATADVQGAATTLDGLGWRRRMSLYLMIQCDYFGMSHITLVAYALVPVMMAAWSLLRNGTRFEYIVGAKPT